MNADQAKAVAASRRTAAAERVDDDLQGAGGRSRGQTRLQARAELAQRLGAGHAHGRRRRLVPRRRDQRRVRQSQREGAGADGRGLADWYKKSFPNRLERVLALDGAQADPDRRLLRHEDAGRAVHAVRAGPHGPSPRPARRPTCGRWAARCRAFTAAASTSSGRGRTDANA